MPLVAHYPLQEDSGSTAHDVRGGNHGTTSGGVTMNASGILGQSAFSFDGTDDYTTAPVIIPDSQLSISFWFKSTSSLSYDTGFGLRDSSTGHDLTIYTHNDDYGGLATVRWTGTGYNLEPGVDYRDGVWHHVTLSDRVLDGAELYVDGNSVAVAGGVDSDYNFNGQSPNIARRGGDGGGGRHANASICDVRVYDHALTQQEVQYLYEVSQRQTVMSSKRVL